MGISIPSAGRLLIQSSGAAAWNMAVDEVLLENATRDGELALRFYAWTEASVSLGYFQRSADRSSHPASSTCDWVRRPSGGGALVHDVSSHDLTYCMAVPNQPRRRVFQTELYELFHQSLVQVLADAGVTSQLCRAEDATSDHPFLCFRRHTEGDVLIDRHKIAGSAQRRSSSAVMQHGSVLLDRSSWAPELPGIRQVAGKQMEPQQLADAWLDTMQSRWPIDWKTAELTASERQRVEVKIRQKFASRAWNHRR